MNIIVLGSSAGGGFPQWNCSCNNCKGFRSGKIKARARTQSSIAIELNNHQWVLINASPDIHHQLLAQKLTPSPKKIRNNPLAAIILTDSQLDHTAGLLLLREDKPLSVYATQSVCYDLTHDFPIMNVLSHYCGVKLNTISVGDNADFTVENNDHLVFTPIPLHSNAPPYSRHRDKTVPGDNIGLLISDKNTNKKLFYAPGIEMVDATLLKLMNEVDCLLIDGTVWHNDELARAGVGTTLATAMGHMPLSGEQGLISHLNTLATPRKILVHINNTNPILNEDSPERAELSRFNIEVGYDGMEIQL